METVIARIPQEEATQPCHIEACPDDAIYAVVDYKEDGSEQELFFCELHGVEFAANQHLTLSDEPA